MSNQVTLYLKLSRNIESCTEDVRLSAVAKMTCTDSNIIHRLKTVRICKFAPEKKRAVVSILKIIDLIQEIYPNVTVSSEGESEVVIEYIRSQSPYSPASIFKIILVCMISFFGTAFTIMAFHNDIGISQVFQDIYQMITGDIDDGFTVLEISYSIGLAAGIILFFNHIGSRRITKDPTPIEVEMRKYEEDVNTTLVDTADREEIMIDVD